MPKTSFDPTLFLDRYREFVTALARLAASVKAPPARLIEELSREPFTVPGIVRGVEGAREIGASLESLAHELPRDFPPSEIELEMQAIMRHVIAAAYQLPPAAAPSKRLGKRRGGTARAVPQERGEPGPTRGARKRNGGMTLGVPSGGATPPAAAPAPVVPSRPTEPGRWINAEIEDHSLDEALELGITYTIAFDIGVRQRPSAVTSRFDDRGLFPEGVDEVTLTVQLGSEDFDIPDNVRPLRVPRSGQSRGKARFDITPKKIGRAVLHATFLKDGNFVQQMEVVLFVVAAGRRNQAVPPAEVTSHGRPLSAAGTLQARDVGLSIKPSSGGGYDCTVWGSVRADVKLPVRDAELAKQIDVARRDLMKVITQQDATGRFVFQTGIDIPEAETEKALRTLARTGALLFTKIFYHPQAGPEARRVGDWLRARASEATTRLKLQVLAEGFPVPWGLLYVGDVAAGAKLDWNGFLGFRHVIEQIPLQAQFGDPGPTIASKPRLAVSINVNDGIDAQMGMPFVEDQRTFWSETATARTRLRLTSRRTRAEVLQALGATPEDDQIAYFYCHADSANLAAAGGPGSSCLVMSGDERITLDDLNVEAPTSVQLAGSPLIFINACESAELTPTFYDGFVPYFMAKGARGVIGTECKTPALFAAEWAKRFFPRLLDGESIGDAFLALRKEFLDQHRNPLGLLYAVHCDGDTQVAPAL